MATKKTAKSTVSLKVVNEFIDKTNGAYRKPAQPPFEATPERAKELIELGLCVEANK
jgi:hypothetical protein